MTETSSLENHFIIAMPNLLAPLFYQSVIYICEHNEEGAMGIMINRALDISMDEILKQMQFEVKNIETQFQQVLCGGPVQMERGFVIHQSGSLWEGSVELEDGICISSSKDILKAIAAGEGPDQSLVALGFAGWGAGQLEQELAENSWFMVPMDKNLMFEVPFEQRWEYAARSLGFDLKTISAEVGHA